MTDAGLEHLKGLTKLQSLWLVGTNVTLEHLDGLTSLQWLDLSLAPVTDAGLENLKGLTNLRLLALGGTKVTGAGVKKIHRALPDCDIMH